MSLEQFGTETDLLLSGVPPEGFAPLLGGSPKQPRTLERGSRPGVCPATIRRGGDAFHFGGGVGHSMSNDLTSDNPYLSRPKLGLVAGSAVNCTDLPDAVAGYVRASLADNTRRAYLSDLRHFEAWGGSTPRLRRNGCCLPGRPRRYASPWRPWSGVSPRSQRPTSARAAQSNAVRAGPGDAARHQADPRLRPARGQAPAPRRPPAGARRHGRRTEGHPGSGIAAGRLCWGATTLGAGRARRGGYRACPAGHRPDLRHSKTDQDGQGRQDRHPVWPDPLVPRRCHSTPGCQPPASQRGRYFGR